MVTPSCSLRHCPTQHINHAVPIALEGMDVSCELDALAVRQGLIIEAASITVASVHAACFRIYPKIGKALQAKSLVCSNLVSLQDCNQETAQV